MIVLIKLARRVTITLFYLLLVFGLGHLFSHPQQNVSLISALAISISDIKVYSSDLHDMLKIIALKVP